jgi:glycosyltransferase involved in cell wall biosynthesis
MADPKITVIVPTRERCDVLEKCLRTLTSQSYDNLEILVSDNSSSDATAEIVTAAKDKRIRYVNTGRRISMSHNWEFALSHVSDGWVTFIGDDDGFPPHAISTAAAIIKKGDVKAIRSTFATYEWPEVSGHDHGHLIVPRSRGLELRTASFWLNRVLNGQAKYTDLPMLYNGGFVDISVLQKIKRITGRYFSSLSPDVYSAVAIARVIDRYAFSFEPLAISGVSRHSTGTSFYSKSTTRDQTSSQKFSEEANIAFHQDLPLCRDGSYPLSLQVLVYEAYLQSRELQPESAVVDRARQLEIILASSGRHRKTVYEWGQQFSDQHGLDFQSACRRAFFRSIPMRSRDATRKIAKAIRSDYAGSTAIPIRDVYEASVAMTNIQNTSPFLGALGAEVKRRIRQL